MNRLEQFIMNERENKSHLNDDSCGLWLPYY